MNKLKKGFLIALPFITLGLTSCGGKKVAGIKLSDNYDHIIMSGDFDLADYQFIITYTDGSTETVAVDDTMLSDAERLKFYKVGEQEITLTYAKTDYVLSLEVVNQEFEVTMEKQVVTYDGNPHSLTIDGYYPKGTTITWPNGNSFTNAGTYDVVAVLSYPGYDNKTLKSTITIELAEYDMSDVTFYNSSLTKDETLEDTYHTTYTGDKKTFALSGTIPSGVTVTYTISGDSGNQAYKAGTYHVVAHFKSDNINYVEIPDMEADFVIDKATYDTKKLTVGNTNVAYTGKEYTWTLQNTLPSWISVTYENNTATEIGFTTMTIHFTVSNENYNDIPDMQFELTIWEEVE